ncbi:alpha/beta hydrolase [Pedobacter sp. KR3-3]|uniref:Alpha/beta hydrolase n=1 Tax=Pedobacter albus TaxID=3113905 RepID=A0ABU7I4D2_9SPHI|nr:alpha/beta hydrolase [Pedobacter sp. KR3-3]MEE1944254.1 alpha/beta hydrolase [Pedobacter sp. KR3-3]
MTLLKDDVTATRTALDAQDGPAILAGHSWGDAVITEADNHPNVAGLVYIAAFQPDNDESALQWFQTAQPAPGNGVLPGVEDKSINPEIQRNVYKRSNTMVTEIEASHVVYVSQPEKVATFIAKATRELSAE